MGYVVAKYIRLSIEDAKTESLSVENQRSQLDRYLADFDVPGIKVIEFVDNGHTGTNMDRPAFQSLIEQVEQGLVNCIVVKDFSRFGRDMVNVGYYIEKIFPLFRVRFISLGDSYDSDDYQNGACREDLAFQLMVNEFYSKDISQKIRDAKHRKMKDGLLVRKDCVFGYQLDADRKMVPDPKAAKVVRRIFEMRLQGGTLKQIARALYMDGIPTPGVYKGHRAKKAQDPAFACIWETATIHCILHDEQYTGAYVAGKSTISGVGSGKQQKKDESKWVKIPGHHPAIVSRAEFDAVQRSFVGKKKPQADGKQQKKTPAKKKSPLQGKVLCGHCGRAMRPDGRQDLGLGCAFTQHAPEIPCHGLSIRAVELEATVFERLRVQLAVTVDAENAPQPAETGRLSVADANSPTCLYERFLAGELDEEAYKGQLARMDNEKRRLKTAPAVPTDLPGLGPVQNIDLPKLARMADTSPALTLELADALVGKVLVHPNGDIEIQWKAGLSGDD